MSEASEPGATTTAEAAGSTAAAPSDLPDAPNVEPAPSLDPGQPSVVEAFDSAVDRMFDHIRGKPAADLTAVVLSNLADYGAAWSLLATAKARRRGPARRKAVRALGVAGVSSALVNSGVKQIVGRQRPEGAPTTEGADGEPTGAGREPLPVRAPRTSSFPSGHTLAAFCTALVLSDTPAQTVSYLTFAAAVAASRVHLRAHHASDVLGGAAVGVALGVVERRFLRSLG